MTTQKSTEPWSIKRLLSWTTDYFLEKQVDSARLCAELLLSHVLGLERIQLYVNFDKTVAPGHLDTLRPLVKRAGAHEPLAYLIGRTEFYSLPLIIEPGVLIPRPETELLVEKAIDFLREHPGSRKVLDLCTGSGCIAVAIARNHADARVTAADKSSIALDTARQNIAMHSLNDRVGLLEGDLFGPIPAGERFDLIVSNPPYVSEQEYEALEPNVKDYEPREALLAGTDGLDFYRRIIADIGNFLTNDGTLMLETGYRQAQEVKKLLDNTELFQHIRTYKDMSGHERVVTARRGTK